MTAKTLLAWIVPMALQLLGEHETPNLGLFQYTGYAYKQWRNNLTRKQQEQPQEQQ
jgi:hypothetical protein